LPSLKDILLQKLEAVESKCLAEVASFAAQTAQVTKQLAEIKEGVAACLEAMKETSSSMLKMVEKEATALKTEMKAETDHVIAEIKGEIQGCTKNISEMLKGPALGEAQGSSNSPNICWQSLTILHEFQDFTFSGLIHTISNLKHFQTIHQNQKQHKIKK